MELISNIGHYYYTALSLLRVGYLGHYITGPSALDNDAWMARLGDPFKRLWNERRLWGIPPHLVKRMWLPEIIQKGTAKLGWTSEQSNSIHNELFARTASRMVEECDAVHFANSIGREVARKAKMNGAKVICDMREEHPNFQETILSEEAKKFGLDFVIPAPVISIEF